LISFALLMLWIPACSPRETPTIQQPLIPRDMDPQISSEELALLSEGTTSFAMGLYQALTPAEANFCFSPFSISCAMTMCLSGAEGETESQMRETMCIQLPEATLHQAMNRLSLDLQAHSEAESTFTLHMANAIWGQTGHDFLPGFLEVLARSYGSGLQVVDFTADPESCRLEINSWADRQTEGRIPDLIPSDALTTATRLVLTNAVYFKAQWLFPFDEYMTMDRPFFLASGDQIRVPTMTISEHFRTARGQGYAAVEMKYRGGRIRMLVIVPDEGFFNEIEQSMSSEFLASVISGLRDESLHLYLPRFSTESSFMLEEALSDMGMPSAFGMTADFSGMDGQRSLYISSVIHQTFVSVDEAGTEAAAATAVIMEKMNGESSMDFMVDRPFIFVVMDGTTGTILFMGRIMNPLDTLGT